MHGSLPAPIVPPAPPVAPREWHWALDGHPPGPNQLRGHWRTQARLTKPWLEATMLLVRADRPAVPLRMARLTLTLVYDSHRMYDYDNAVASIKYIQDGLVRGGLLAGDDRHHVTLEVRQVIGHAKQVLIDVVEVIGG